MEVTLREGLLREEGLTLKFRSQRLHRTSTEMWDMVEEKLEKVKERRTSVQDALNVDTSGEPEKEALLGLLCSAIASGCSKCAVGSEAWNV